MKCGGFCIAVEDHWIC